MTHLPGTYNLWIDTRANLPAVKRPKLGSKGEVPSLYKDPSQNTGGNVVFGAGDTDQLVSDRHLLIPLTILKTMDIIDVACGEMRSMVITRNGEGVEGILGFSPSVKKQEFPVLCESLKHETIVDIAAGDDHCLALTVKGRVYSWGGGDQKQLGRRSSPRLRHNGLIPTKLTLKNVKAVQAGSYHSFALTHENKLYVWGLNNYDQCDLPTDDSPMFPSIVAEPTLIRALEGKGDIQALMAYGHLCLIFMENGSVFSFGRADSSQLDVSSETAVMHCSAGDWVIKKETEYPLYGKVLKNIVETNTCSNHNTTTDQLGVTCTWRCGETNALGNDKGEDELAPVKLEEQTLDDYLIPKAAAGSIQLSWPERCLM
ncbi:hypothetical protein DFQ30_010269 [Apophysomyces sp. BC1015]|nr:hypothetical protein DFQ30_010269 [Apophysomyces sp. BC1015]